MELLKLENLPGNSRLWVYQADRKLSNEEEERVALEVSRFVSQWAAHGNALAAAFEIKYHQFLVIAVNENVAAATGCSIDSSVRFIAELGAAIDIDFLNRQQVAFLEEGEVLLRSLSEVRKGIGLEGRHDILTFNNSVASLDQFRTSWQVPVRESWMARFLNTDSVGS